MEITKLKNHQSHTIFNVRQIDVKNAKSCEGNVVENGKSTNVTLYVFPMNGTYYCGLIVDGNKEIGRLIEVTPNFYFSIQDLNTRSFSKEFCLDVFELRDY